jgi:hypothetical protein
VIEGSVTHLLYPPGVSQGAWHGLQENPLLRGELAPLLDEATALGS